MNMTNQIFLDLLKAYSRKYTHRKKVYSSAKGKMVWRYYYQEHHGGGVTRVDNLEAGDAFKVKYNGVEGHFDIKKVKGDIVTVVHSETGKETDLTKAELRAVLLKTHAKALKRNVKKKEEALARTKNKRSRERAQQRLMMAKRKIQGLEAEQEDNFETMPETEQESNWLALSDQEYIDKNRELERQIDFYNRNLIRDKDAYGREYLEGFTAQQKKEVKQKVTQKINSLKKELGKDKFKYPKDKKELVQRMKDLTGYLKDKYGIELNSVHSWHDNTMRIETSTPRELRNLVKEKHYHVSFRGFAGSSNQITDPTSLIKLLETLERDQAKSNFETMPETEQKPETKQESETKQEASSLEKDLLQEFVQTRPADTKVAYGRKWNKKTVDFDAVFLSEMKRRLKQGFKGSQEELADLLHTVRKLGIILLYRDVAIGGSENFFLTEEEAKQGRPHDPWNKIHQSTENRDKARREIIKVVAREIENNFETMPETEQEPLTQAPKDARSSLVEQAEKVIQEVHDKHEDKPLAHKSLNNFEIGEHTHTKTGETAHTVKSKKRVSRSEFLEHKKKARELGGFYSKFTSKFHFKEKDKALEFAHHFEPVQDQAEEVKQDAKKEDHTHHENNFETMPETESVGTGFSDSIKQQMLSQIRLALRFDKTGKTRSMNRKTPVGSNIAHILYLELINKVGKKIPNAGMWLSEGRVKQADINILLESLARSNKTEQEVIQAFEKVLTSSYRKVLDEHLSRRVRLYDNDIKPFTTKRLKQSSLRSRVDSLESSMRGSEFDKEAKDIGLRVTENTIKQGLEQARTTIEDHYKKEIERSISRHKDKSFNQKKAKEIKEKLVDLKQQLSNVDQISLADRGRMDSLFEILNRAIDNLPPAEQTKYKEKIEAENEQYKESAKKEIPKMIEALEKELKETQKELKAPFTANQEAQFKLDLLNRRMQDLKDVEKDTYHGSKIKTQRGKALHKLETKIVERMISDLEQDKSSFGSSSKEILEQYDTSDLDVHKTEDFDKLDPQRSKARFDSYRSIYRNIEDKLKEIDGGVMRGFSYQTHDHGNVTRRYNLKKLKQDLNPVEIVDRSYSETGYNDSITNRYITLDDGIDKLAQKYEFIDDVRENKDAILTELKKMAQSTYENRIRGFESAFSTDYKKKEVEEFFRRDLENTLKDKQGALERLKGKLPSSVHQALKTESEKGLKQHAQDIEVMINHYNTELDKIVDKEKASYPTKGDIYNTIQANLPKYKSPHLQGMYTGEKKFEAKVQGKPHKKLIAKMFNEIMEQVAREKANEPTGLVQGTPASKPSNAREEMIQTAEAVQDNFETMSEVDYESLNRGQKIKIQDKVYTVAVKRDRSFSSVGHAIQLNDENRKPAGILIFNDNGTVRFKDMKGLEDIKDLKEAQLITGNKEQSIKFKNDPREPLPKPTGGIISNMSRRREAQKQTRQPRKEAPQAVSTADQTAGDKQRLETLKTNLDIELENAVQMQQTDRAQRNLPHPKDGGGEFHLTNQIDPRYMEALEKKMYRGFKSAVPNLHPQNVVKLDNMYYMNVAQVRADAQKQEDEYYKLFKVLINDKINKYTEAYHNIETLKKDIERRIPYADTNGTEETRKAHRDYLLKVSKEALKQLKSVEATKGEAFNALKKTYFTAKKTGHAKQKALAEIANKAIDRVYQEIKDQPTSKPDVMYFVSMISKYSKPTNAREQMVQVAENVQAQSTVKQTHNEILKDVADSASDKLLEIALKHYSYLRSYGKRDETDLQVSNERRMIRRINRMISQHLKAGNYDKATIDELSNLEMDSPQMQVFIELLHDKALENKRQQREQATETATQEPPNLQHTQADLNAIPMQDFERAYYNQSHSAGERGRSKKREYVNTLNQFESLAQELIDLGADKAKVQQLAKQSAERYTNALKDELSSESKVASWFVVGRGGFNTRRQEKLRDYASNKRSKTIQVRNQAIKNFEKLRLSDPNSARATQEQRNQEALKELADWKKRAEDTRAKAKAESVVLPVNSSLPMTKQNFHSLKTGSRIKLTYKVDGEAKTEEFQIGRESHSKKKFTTTRKLHPIVDGKVDKTIDVSIYSMENHPYLGDSFRLSDGRVRWANTEMQNFEVLPKIKKAYHKLNPRELLLKALTA